MRVALVQLNARANKAKNVEKALKLVSDAIRSKASFVLLPEVFNYRGPLNKKILFETVAEKIPGDSSRPFLELAKKHKVFILIGSLYESIDRNDSKVYNTSLLIGDEGRLIAKYRKMNMFDAVIGAKVIRESDNFLKGDRPATARIKNFNLGMSVCYDLRFPRLYREYSQRGCHLLTIPSSFTKKTGEAHWEILVRARAVENLSYCLAPNQVGRDGRGVESYGNSLVVDPWGKILARASSNKEENVYAEINIDVVKKMRTFLPGAIG